MLLATLAQNENVAIAALLLARCAAADVCTPVRGGAGHRRRGRRRPRRRDPGGELNPTREACGGRSRGAACHRGDAGRPGHTQSTIAWLLAILAARAVKDVVYVATRRRLSR